MGKLGDEMVAMKDSLACQDLASEGGVHKGIALQNQVKGVNRVLDLIGEIANYEEPAS